MSMTIKQMAERLDQIAAKHGNLKIVGGYLSDDRGPSKLTVINTDGGEYRGGKNETIDGVFVE